MQAARLVEYARAFGELLRGANTPQERHAARPEERPPRHLERGLGCEESASAPSLPFWLLRSLLRPARPQKSA